MQSHGVAQEYGEGEIMADVTTSKKVIQIAAPTVDESTMNAVDDVFRSGMLAQGAKVAEFEEHFASYIGTKYAVATNSGTAALQVALLACGIKSGDEVITTPFSFIASANCALYCGAKPVFSDIDSKTYNIDPYLLRERITPRTKVILPVHLYGQPCDMKELMAICDQRGLKLIEDACQAHGAEYEGKKVGSFGIGCFSFYATKNMTTGEGGMITTNDKDIAEKARVIRDQGQTMKYFHEILSYNFRMTNMAGALGTYQLKTLDEKNNKRKANAKYLTNEISKIEGLITPFIAPGRTHVFHQFTIRVTSNFHLTRDTLQKKLAESGIGTGVNYPIPIHKQPIYQKMGYKYYLPVAEEASEQVLSLPVHPGVSEDDLKRIVEALKNA